MANDRRSKMVIAMAGWEKATELKTNMPSGTFGWNVSIRSGNVHFGNNHDIEFNIPFDDDTECNEAEIVVYNLTGNTISQLKHDQVITVTAGYQKDSGVIFSGRITKVSTKHVGVDKQTVIYALDSQGKKERKISSLSFKKGVKASYILRTLIDKLRMPVAVFKVRRDHTYSDSVTVDGNLMESIRQYSDVCGVSTYINKGKVYSRWLKDGDNTRFILQPSTGLIGSPELFEEEINIDDAREKITGYKLKMLLQHRITTAAIITIKSKNVSGTFRVRSGEHKFDGRELITECEVI